MICPVCSNLWSGSECGNCGHGALFEREKIAEGELEVISFPCKICGEDKYSLSWQIIFETWGKSYHVDEKCNCCQNKQYTFKDV